MYYKSYLESYISIIKRRSQYGWLKISQSLFNNLNNDIYLCFLYNAPTSSRYYDDNFFDNMSIDTLNYCDEESRIIFIGDFNGRVSNLVDHVQLDDIQISFQPQLIGDYRQRNNRDKDSNNIGKQLLEFCKTFSLRILNGRKNGDFLGNFTHYNKSKGQTVVDYGIVSENVFDNIKKFMIFLQSELSDHCKIAIEIANMKDIRNQNNTYRWLTLNKAFKWTENSSFKFQKAFNQTEIKTLIQDFHNSLPSDNIDSIGTKLTNILNSVGKISLRRNITDFTQKSPKRFTGKTKKKSML